MDQQFDDAPCSSSNQPSTSQQNSTIQKFGLKFGNKVLVLRVAEKKDKSYFCKYCSDAYFHTHQQLKKHMKKHGSEHGSNSKFCKLCGVEFFSNKALIQHCRFSHGRNILGFTCNQCGKQFTTRQYLNLHVRTHNVGDRFYCSQCGHWYRNTDELDKHSLHCKDQKRLSCSYCSKTFKYPKCKLVHERTHSGEKPFNCKHCDAQFSQMSACKVHEKIHMKEKKHKCRFCPAEYVDSSAARRHELRHHYKECQEIVHN